MTRDPIVREIRAIREKHAAAFGYDVRAIFADLKRTERRRKGDLLPVPSSDAPVPTPSVRETRFAGR